ncbi:MAG TPA: hypothetical protein PKG74_03065 [Candidatus Colwellbacteria bacterium]|nr:hypothetical protein [Candidatus Colwellbacteria bacterium]
MDIVYILGRGSKWQNNELRFSLRSIVKNFRHGKVWIIGEFPKWLRNCEHVAALDPYDNKLSNAIFKIRTACRTPEISERFVLMNDDFYFLRKIDSIQAFTLGTMSKAILEHKTQAGYYFHAFRETRNLLQAAGHQEPANYEVHYPIVFEKKKFLAATDALEWETTLCLFRSIYGNTFNIGNKKRIDTKVYDISELSKLTEGDLLSSSDRVVLRPKFQKFIYEKFPDPSQYEDPKSDPGKLP